jgi:hypothetical protein
MTLRGFLFRLVFVAMITWTFVGFTNSIGWALYFALTPIAFYEALRSR